MTATGETCMHASENWCQLPEPDRGAGQPCPVAAAPGGSVCLLFPDTGSGMYLPQASVNFKLDQPIRKGGLGWCQGIFQTPALFWSNQWNLRIWRACGMRVSANQKAAVASLGLGRKPGPGPGAPCCAPGARQQEVVYALYIV